MENNRTYTFELCLCAKIWEGGNSMKFVSVSERQWQIFIFQKRISFALFVQIVGNLMDNINKIFWLSINSLHADY